MVGKEEHLFLKVGKDSGFCRASRMSTLSMHVSALGLDRAFSKVEVHHQGFER